ncbi:MAG TPA: VTT domain-containing protein [Candidatus Cybelea sp.]|jgi:membrane protein YqaA with SNARE-associated domain|nr:VTT domain-containing protein [Candidatus Cybelea sp.]
MLTRLLIAAATPTAARSLRRWIYHLGALGFIPLGLLDSSIIPLPGSMDVLTIVLAARDATLWPYYALMATVGSVLGAFVTYRLARKGGKESLARKVSAKTLKRVYEIFERWGFAAIAIPALLPPPMPMVPFVLAAGAMQYSVNKFLLAITLGRIVRYLILAYLAARYGRKMLPLLLQHGHPEVAAVVGLAVTAVLVYFMFRGIKSKKRRKS